MKKYERNALVGERIMKVRMEQGLSREFVAKEANMSLSFLFEIENGRKGFSASTLVKLSKVLNASMEYIMLGKESPQVSNQTIQIIKKFDPKVIEKIEVLLKAIYDVTRK